jgi:hypothetical protein
MICLFNHECLELGVLYTFVFVRMNGELHVLPISIHGDVCQYE